MQICSNRVPISDDILFLRKAKNQLKHFHRRWLPIIFRDKINSPAEHCSLPFYRKPGNRMGNPILFRDTVSIGKRKYLTIRMLDTLVTSSIGARAIKLFNNPYRDICGMREFLISCEVPSVDPLSTNSISVN